MKNLIKQELLGVLERFPQGASLEEIMLGLPVKPRRTVQRHLALLIQEGLVLALGAARARRYRLIPKAQMLTPLLKDPILLSRKAIDIQEFITKPVAIRPPVGYLRRWLESYLPNVTQYIPDAMREHLYSLGRVEEGGYVAGTFARTIFARLLVDLSWNSSRLEGNTYSFLDTEKLIQWGEIPKGKNLKETQMILNHKAAIEFLVESAKEVGVNRYTILNLHTLLSDGLLSDPVFSGRLRVYPVGISHSTYIPLAIPQVIQECFDLLLEKAHQIQDPFEQAFFLMVHIPYLQAFEDVNKRTSRLAANIPLIRHNLRPLSFIDVPEHLYINGLLGVYELNKIELLRDVFIWAYERSCARYATTRGSLQDPDPFRLLYRAQIQQAIKDIVTSLDREAVLQAIQRHAAEGVPLQDQAHFVNLVEKELSSLHEGNIALYKITPSQYAKWQTHLQL